MAAPLTAPGAWPTPRADRSRGPFARLRERRRRRRVPEGIRITKVGLWYVLFTLIVAVAATNTGNNALYMVLSAMLGLLVVSGLSSQHNLRDLEARFEAPAEIFARRPLSLSFVVRNGGRFLPRWLLLLAVERTGPFRLIPYLPHGEVARGSVDLLFPRRGRHRLEHTHFASLFPLGLFRKGLRYPLGLDLLVYPELFGAGNAPPEPSGRTGDHSSRRVGWGHELHSLRAYRQGDDPRGIHWKQTARTGTMIYLERATEENLRLTIVFDNAVGQLADAAAAARFEYLVSEAATAAVDHLERGFEVELVTRDQLLPFAGGGRQRRAVLEALALIEPLPRRRHPLGGSDPTARQLRLSLGEEGP